VALSIDDSPRREIYLNSAARRIGRQVCVRLFCASSLCACTVRARTVRCNVDAAGSVGERALIRLFCLGVHSPAHYQAYCPSHCYPYPDVSLFCNFPHLTDTTASPSTPIHHPHFPSSAFAFPSISPCYPAIAFQGSSRRAHNGPREGERERERERERHVSLSVPLNVS